MRTKTMIANHSGSIETSKALKDAARWVRQRLTWTSIQMTNAIGCVSARDICRHLRANGLNISRARYERITEDKKRVYRWDLL